MKRSALTIIITLIILSQLCLGASAVSPSPSADASPTPSSTSTTATPSPSAVETSPTPPSPSVVAVPASPALSGAALLSKVIVSGVSQDTTNPRNVITMTVALENLNNTAMPGVMASITGGSSEVVSLTHTFGPFENDLDANGTSYFQFDLYILPTVLGGDYPINLTLTYTDASGAVTSVTRTISVLVDRGTGLSGIKGDQTGTPRVVLGNYSIGSEQVFGGDSFELSYSLVNKNNDAQVSNVLVNFTSESNAYTPVNGTSNQVFIDSIPANTTWNGKLKFKANNTLKSGTYNLTLSIQYEDSLNGDYSSNSIISIPLQQEQKLSINSITLPEAAILGNKIPLNVRYENPGTSEIKNLTMNIQGELEGKEKTVALGSVKAGNAGYVDQYITPKAQGTQQYSVTFTFEDTDGNAYTTPARTVTVNVQSKDNALGALENSGAGSIANGAINLVAQKDYTWIIIVAIGVLVAVITTIVLIARATKKKKAMKWKKEINK